MCLKLWPSLTTGDTSSYILEEEYFFPCPVLSQHLPQSQILALSLSLLTRGVHTPTHCLVPPCLVSEFPLLTSFYFLVPSSVCCFLLVKFLPSFQLLKEIPCLHCLSSGRDVSSLSDFYFEQPKLEKSTFFDFEWSTFSPGWRWCTYQLCARQELWGDRTRAVTLCGQTASSFINSSIPEKLALKMGGMEILIPKLKCFYLAWAKFPEVFNWT